MTISMTNQNIGDGPLLKTYDNMLHNMFSSFSIQWQYLIHSCWYGITLVKLTSIMHTLGWTLFSCFMYAEIIHDSVHVPFCAGSMS